ncbi:plasmid partitioning protein RepA [Rhizobium leguminosarum]|uniref:Replication protein n=1 Tax=Rhizobium johnstonii (strain DSM 114642 / LMG 32736 / 3841) TaxID=216596 RepID=Q1M9Y0_RHIJ3|nr:plasmid partitioning protein RepA [Rhizobium leguminosarum]NEJ81849.1 plasmid partitioning protein RepA [Rhizobium leguminosarum]CAK11562.1 putative replication protein [Rhizobium johnstonii 3841]
MRDSNVTVATNPNRRALPSVYETIGEQADLLSSHLQSMSEAFPLTSQKILRKFTSGEAARLMNVSDSTLRKMSLVGEGPQPETTSNGRRLYTLPDINQIRHLLAQSTRGRGSIEFAPHRRPGGHLQVLAVTNFKGGSGKTTTSAHLVQYQALQGYRVPAVDLEPQASLSALLGVLPELDVASNQTLYAAIRYDRNRRGLSDVIRPTYFDGLDLVLGNFELMEFEHTTPKALSTGAGGETLFFTRVTEALDEVADNYGVMVIDGPPQLGFLTLSGLCAATAMIVTVHPQMLDISSMSWFLLMIRDLLGVVRDAGSDLKCHFIRYLLTRFEPQDAPQTKVARLHPHGKEKGAETDPGSPSQLVTAKRTTLLGIHVKSLWHRFGERFSVAFRKVDENAD